MPTRLHEERLDAVLQVLLDSGAGSVLDLGCGSGELLKRLFREPQFVQIVGVDTSLDALETARRQLPEGAAGADRLSFLRASCTEYNSSLCGFDAAALVETIEHLEPHRLSALEATVFRRYRPRVVIITTPNRDFNSVLGVSEGRRRHPDHRFEWTRAKFASWSEGVARRRGYTVRHREVGENYPALGGATQMASFARGAPAARSVSPNSRVEWATSMKYSRLNSPNEADAPRRPPKQIQWAT